MQCMMARQSGNPYRTRRSLPWIAAEASILFLNGMLASFPFDFPLTAPSNCYRAV